jgi:APA family basic amino acid/polyamine antiporter
MEKTEEGLKREVGPLALAMSIVNMTVGAGIFVLPGIVGVNLGAFGVFGYVFCAILLASIMLSYAEIGSKVTTSGGSYAYVEAAFGRYPGFVINWLFFFGWGLLGSAAIINVAADSLAILFPIFGLPLVRALFFACVLGLLVFVNIRGAKEGVRLVQFFTIIKLAPLILIIFFGIGLIKTENLMWDELPTVANFGQTAFILFFAFSGFETTLGVSGELKNPKRTVPLGLLLGGVILMLTYMLLQMVIQGALGAEVALFKDAPLAAVADKIIGPIGATILIIVTAISCLGNNTGDILATPRLLFAGAKDGFYPKFLARVHPKYATPYLAVIIYAALIFIFSVAGGFEELAVLASCAILLIYLSVILATIKMRRKMVENAEQTFTIPGGLIVPSIGIIAIIWLLTMLSIEDILATLAFIGIVSLIYWLMKKSKNLTSRTKQ